MESFGERIGKAGLWSWFCYRCVFLSCLLTAMRTFTFIFPGTWGCPGPKKRDVEPGVALSYVNMK
jgi:hypothetical protein